MSKCTFCGRESDERTKFVGGYEILNFCTDCEDDILKRQNNDNNILKGSKNDG